jgi:hypothetical protein
MSKAGSMADIANVWASVYAAVQTYAVYLEQSIQGDFVLPLLLLNRTALNTRNMYLLNLMQDSPKVSIAIFIFVGKNYYNIC